VKFHVETREVLAAAYLGPTTPHGRMLSHAAVVNEDGAVASVLCRRVSVDSLADRGASDPSATPTCDRCRAAIKKRAAAREAP
jgi:hypothetical protein